MNEVALLKKIKELAYRHSLIGLDPIFIENLEAEFNVSKPVMMNYLRELQQRGIIKFRDTDGICVELTKVGRAVV
jgi:Mn-dependent DtxR family transcriptional regulator